VSDSERKFDRRLPVLLAAVGVLFSGALELAHYQAYVDPTRASFCSPGAAFDCTTVALSSWSVFLDVPLPLWGLSGFLLIGLLAFWRSLWLVPVTGFAAALSVVLLGVALFAIHKVCWLCECVHVLSWVLFALAWRGRAGLGTVDRVTLAQLFTVPAAIPIYTFIVIAHYWAIATWRGGVHLPHGFDENGRPWIGAEAPKLVLHEYVDYSCPHCAIAAMHTARWLSQHPTTLRIVRHQYPRMQCPLLPDLFYCPFVRTALCAGDQGVFWEADSWLFEHAGGRLEVDLHKAASDLHIDYDKLNACVSSPATLERAAAETAEASTHKIKEVPSYVIDGKRFRGDEIYKELRSRL
jgi:uncharacterized membrane protein